MKDSGGLQKESPQPKEKSDPMYDPGPGFKPMGEHEVTGTKGEMTSGYPSDGRKPAAATRNSKKGGKGGIDGSHF